MFLWCTKKHRSESQLLMTRIRYAGQFKFFSLAMTRCLGTRSYAFEKSKLIAPKCFLAWAAMPAAWMNLLRAWLALCAARPPNWFFVNSFLVAFRVLLSMMLSIIFVRLVRRLIGLNSFGFVKAS